MKNPSDSASPLASLTEKTEKAKAQAETIERELVAKLKDREKTLSAAEATVGKIRAVVERMEGEYFEMLAEVERDERARIEARSVGLQDVQAGKVDMKTYFNDGLTADQVSAKAKAEAAAKTAGLVAVIREKRRELVEAEVAQLTAASEAGYLRVSPSLLFVEALKQLLADAQATIPSIMSEWLVDRTALDTKKDELSRINDTGPNRAHRFNTLDRTSIERLKFNPEIPAKFLPELAAAADEMEPGEVADVIVNYRPNSPLYGIQVLKHEVQRRSVFEEVK